MSRLSKGLVSLLVPAVVAALVHGCGGASRKAASQDESTVQTPTAPSPDSSSAGGKNAAPAIENVGDQYARIGDIYAFQPRVGDDDNDELRFTATNLPPWASIDPFNGRISGTPGPSDEGAYESIVIAVADARHRAETAPFTITVLSDAGTGVATLRWDSPPSKVDGSPLDDLAGYRILYGRSPDDLDQSVLINDPAVTSYEFTSLDKGIWYFAVVAVNAGGLEGPPTVVATKSI